MASFGTVCHQFPTLSTHCLDVVLLHIYVHEHGCVWSYRKYVFVCTFTAIPSHSGIVNSLLTKLLNGVTTRANAFSFFSLCIYFLLPSFFSPPHASWLQVGCLAISFYLPFWRSSLVTCRFDEKYMWTARAVRLCKGLTVPFNSTSAPHKTGKATVRLVDYRSQSQMPSNDYLATSKVQ